MSNSIADNTLIMVILCIVLPPLAVGLKKGIGVELVIGIVLFMLFYVPGLIYALWITFKS